MYAALIALVTGAALVTGPGDVTTDPGPSCDGRRATIVAAAGGVVGTPLPT